MLVDVSNVTTTLPPFCCKMTYRIWELSFLTMTKWADILYHFYQVMFLFDPFIQDFNNVLFIQPVKSKPFLIFSWINYYMMRHLINVFIHFFNISFKSYKLIFKLFHLLILSYYPTLFPFLWEIVTRMNFKN